MPETNALFKDAAELAQAVFEREDDARRMLGILRYSISVVDRFCEPRPHHEEWRRIAVIIQLLLCSERPGPTAFGAQAKRRLTAFIEENADLLDFATPAHALAFVN